MKREEDDFPKKGHRSISPTATVNAEPAQKETKRSKGGEGSAGTEEEGEREMQERHKA